MNDSEIEGRFDGAFDAIKEFVSGALQGIAQKLQDLDARISSFPQPQKGEQGPRGAAGESITGPAGKDGADGKDAEPVNIPLVISEVLKQIPIPRDGRDGIDGKDGLSVTGPRGERGSSVLTGNGPPLFSGKEGDLYLDLRTWDLYQCD